MFQAVNHADARGTLGQHFTSVPNIMKVIEPLFLNDLKEEFENARGNNKKLNQLLYRLKNIKIFDPACGSGNFLIIAYKELRRLEMEIFKEMGSLALSEISLSQFYGIEIDDFAHEIAILALWLTKHQMNVEFFKEFGRTTPTLPLTDAGNIVQGNACRLDWEEVCPKGSDEVYLLGNPPYLGQRNQKPTHKNDLDFAFKEFDNYKNLDYVSVWFLKASKYITKTENRFAFVSTTSITQGTQVEMLWPKLFKYDLEIFFAHKNFKWSNNAKKGAGVAVCIIGMSKPSKKEKFLIIDNKKVITEQIGPYLTKVNATIIKKRYNMLADLPKMEGGNQPREGGYLILSNNQKLVFLKEYPQALKYIRPFIGSNEYIKGIDRWCLWINKNEVENALKIQGIKERISLVKSKRTNGNSLERNFINYSYRFVQIKEALNSQLIIPIVSSERREYIPVGFLNRDFIISASANVIYDSPTYLLAIITSKIHNVWVNAVSLKLENRIKYSVGVCYNSFPFPTISKQRKNELTQCTLNIIDERLKHSEKTMAELYDPDKMPEGLKEAHHQNDLAVERCYRSTPFSSDEERLEYLFKLYEKMIQEEKDKDTIFAKEKKTRKRK
jgi:hypothetical protein